MDENVKIIDGFKTCTVCGKRLETEVDYKGTLMRFPCMCDCRKKEKEEREKREIEDEKERKRDVCFRSKKMKSWTFENDDRKRAKLSDTLENYCDSFSERLKDGAGFIFYGSCGTGKSYLAACIANRLIDNGYRCYMTNMATLTNMIQETFEGRNEKVENLNKYSLLIIDDLGIERNSQYMNELVFNIIDSRYLDGKPIIVTTNLTRQELIDKDNTSKNRIYDRLLENCIPIEIAGDSRRIEAGRNLAKNILGGY